MKEWLRKNRSRLPKGELLRRAKAKLEGHLNYYAITDNRRMCQAYSYQVTRLLFKWMNRQSQRRSYTWERLLGALAWVGWPLMYRVRVRLNPCCSTVGSAKSELKSRMWENCLSGSVRDKAAT